MAYGALAVLSIALLVGAWQDLVSLPLDKTEVLAFVTGAWTVWLAVRNNIWNWPIGIANSVFFVALFWQARLYFDMGINVFYVVSGIWGWLLWAFGGPQRTQRPVTRLSRRDATLILGAVIVLTAVMWERGIAIDDAAPFLDALTTALSIAAQWLLMRRQLETWYFWIAADLVYIPLYLSKGLPLTAVLYFGFLLMCLRGWYEWRGIAPAPRPLESAAA
jgi:nicotinamide mononucleotide transporter